MFVSTAVYAAAAHDRPCMKMTSESQSEEHVQKYYIMRALQHHSIAPHTDAEIRRWYKDRKRCADMKKLL